MSARHDLADFIDRSNRALTDDELYGHLERALANLAGYDRVIFSLMTDHPALGLSAGHGLMRNYPDDWMRHYVEKGYEHLDPVRRFGFRHVGPFLWDQLPSLIPLARQQAHCMDECRAAGFYNGAALLLRGVDGQAGGIGVASSSEKKPITAAEATLRLSILNVISTQFYTRFHAIHQSPANTNSGNIAAPSATILTPRERQVLELIAHGIKDDSIAFKLNITRHAVDFHVRRILLKLQSRTRLAAVVKAISTGMITIDQAALISRRV